VTLQINVGLQGRTTKRSNIMIIHEM